MSERAGVQVVRAGALTAATAQTTGMRRQAAVTPETTGSQGLWVGRVTTPAGTASGWHHHGDCETAIYVVQGRARFSWGAGGARARKWAPATSWPWRPGRAPGRSAGRRGTGADRGAGVQRHYRGQRGRA